MLASSGEITDPCPVPLSLIVTTPSSMTPALSHFWIRRMMRRSPIPMLQEADQPLLVDLVEERADVGVQYEAHLLAVDADAERIQRIMRAASWPEPIRQSEEVFLVDRVQQLGHCPLDNLILKRSNRERTLSSVRFGYVNSPARQRPIRSPMDPFVQILELTFKVYLVVRPCQPIHTGCSVLLKFEERLFEQFDADMVEERGELLLLPFLRDFPYAFQRL